MTLTSSSRIELDATASALRIPSVARAIRAQRSSLSRASEVHRSRRRQAPPPALASERAYRIDERVRGMELMGRKHGRLWRRLVSPLAAFLIAMVPASTALADEEDF